MSRAGDERRDEPAGDPADNPTDDELDIEGPNESAPGHEPAEGADPADAESGSAPPGDSPGAE